MFINLLAEEANGDLDGKPIYMLAPQDWKESITAIGGRAVIIILPILWRQYEIKRSAEKDPIGCHLGTYKILPTYIFNTCVSFSQLRKHAVN